MINFGTKVAVEEFLANPDRENRLQNFGFTGGFDIFGWSLKFFGIIVNLLQSNFQFNKICDDLLFVHERL